MSKAKNKGWYCTCPGHISDMSLEERAKRGVNENAPLGILRAPEGVGVKRSLWTTGQTIAIGFMGGTTAQRDKIVAAYAEWKRFMNLNFTYPLSGPYDIRISFNPGSAWSFIGKDAKMVGQAYATMNLGFDQGGTYGHEAGHSVGLGHEQSNPHGGGLCLNWANIITDLRNSQGWDEATIRNNMQMFRPEDVITTPFDRISIMEYPLPGRWVCDGIAIPGGPVLSPTDKAFGGVLYPYATIPVDPPITGNITLTPAQSAELKQGALSVQSAVNAAKVAADAHRARIAAYLGQ